MEFDGSPGLMENISPAASEPELGWDETDRVSLPGFGFFPSRVVQILENITAVKLKCSEFK